VLGRAVQPGIVRMVDQKHNTVVYLTYSNRLIEGSPMNNVLDLLMARLFAVFQRPSRSIDVARHACGAQPTVLPETGRLVSTNLFVQVADDA